MKKIIFFSTSLVLACVLISCELFSKPLYSFSRDISGIIGSMSTADLAGNIDKLASDPKKAADVLNELAHRNQDEISSLSKGDKEKLLEAGIGAILPVSQLGDMVDQLTKEDDMDIASIMDTLTQGTSAINTKALETVLEDDEILEKTDAGTLALGAASLILNTVKTEAGDEENFEEKMTAFQEVAKTVNGSLDKDDFTAQLTTKGFSKESAAALTAAMGVADVLTGDRKADTEKIGFGDLGISDLLDQMTGAKK